MENLARAFDNQIAGDIARCDNTVVGVFRHAKQRHLCDHAAKRTRRIGNQNNRNTLGARTLERCDRSCKSHFAIVQNTPDIAEDRIISIRQIVQAFRQLHCFPQYAGSGLLPVKSDNAQAHHAVSSTRMSPLCHHACTALRPNERIVFNPGLPPSGLTGHRHR